MKTIQPQQKIKSFLLIILISIFNLTYAQSKLGTLKGKIIDNSTNKELSFAKIILKTSHHKFVAGVNSDAEGKYIFKSISPGKYNIEVNYVGYRKKNIKNILITANKIKTLNIKLEQNVELAEYEVVEYDAPLITKDEASVSYEKITTAYKTKKHRIANNATYSGAYYAPQSIKQDNWNTESYAHISENDFKNVNANPLSTFSIDVDAASYSNMRRFVNNGQIPPADAVRVEEMLNYFSYDYPQPKKEHPFSITTEMSDCPWNTNNKLIHIGLQGKKMDMEELPASNIVFLLDVSGSMSSPNKLPLLKKSFGLLVKNLRDIDRVAIVVYAGAAGVVLESTPGNQKEKILNALNRLNAGGSTAGGAGIKLAYKIAQQHFVKEGNNRVVLATDGDFNIGASSDGEMTRLIEQKRESAVFLTCLGFGMGNYKDSKMESLADKGNGNYAYIDNIMEAKKVLVTEMGGTMFTIAKDVKLQLEFNPNKIISYKLIGYENRLLNEEDFNDDTKDAGELGAGHTVTALYEVVLKGTAPSVDPLRYQENKQVKTNNTFTDELLTVKFRYKKPDGVKSKLIVQHLKDNSVELNNASDNFKWSSAVAEFGMLLRDSKHKSQANYAQVLSLAKGSKGNDSNGYRAEFIRLVEMCEMQVSALISE